MIVAEDVSFNNSNIRETIGSGFGSFLDAKAYCQDYQDNLQPDVIDTNSAAATPLGQQPEQPKQRKTYTVHAYFLEYQCEDVFTYTPPTGEIADDLEKYGQAEIAELNTRLEVVKEPRQYYLELEQNGGEQHIVYCSTSFESVKQIGLAALQHEIIGRALVAYTMLQRGKKNCVVNGVGAVRILLADRGQLVPMNIKWEAM
ncbi:MAG: hypothetical protein EBR82_46835 [Caulobacteraceae bacterium]|nr:hypothetical protein [Caulobacteraceae bacterium]